MSTADGDRSEGAAGERVDASFEAAPLARYGQREPLQELANPTRSRLAARLLLVPAAVPSR
ncbi:hypothetical protein [Micromonospora sp. NPDC048830]|uniref:hypothetical protein n=1 Tax=Micromonospora sp. NPDC048830 TaxID=3364257 RepID=UPI00371FBCDE